MIKNLRVTVDGKTYDVTVEIPDEFDTPILPAPPPFSAPALPPPPLEPPPSAPPPAPAAPTAAGPGDVRSPLAGRIVAILAKPGQVVKLGDHLFTVEAMKMNTSVSAPKAGKVAQILTTIASAVDEGQILARIED
ncbi:MAG TPA: biotin/lipoyl-containing protein [Candidatus Acidoferrum sp.]|nr:biotin/lipoyl-containing protein [Candidatus Acidoferrum sp.]